MGYEIRYKSGQVNLATDALSRVGQSELNTITVAVTTPELIEELKGSLELPEGFGDVLN